MQVLVVGAGVVGLAVARTAALRGHDVIVAEATGGIGNGVSSRNSEVVHAGIYYPTASLRARHCVRGRRKLYEFCASHGVATNKCGKLIVATGQAEFAKVETRLAQGLTNGVEGLEMIGGNAARAIEPELACIGALSSRIRHHRQSRLHAGAVGRTGRSRRQHRVRNGGRAHVLRVAALARAIRRPRRRHHEIRCGREFGRARRAGLARKIEDYPAEKVPPLVLAKGNYFAFAGRPVFSRLIYPTPVDGGLGVHVTLDLAGRMRFGPNVEWIDHESYTVDPRRCDSFYQRIRSYWLGLPDGSLVPDYCGIRPKLTGPGEKPADFMIAAEPAHGMPRLVNLFGIKSPGLTSSLSLAEDIVDYLEA